MSIATPPGHQTPTFEGRPLVDPNEPVYDQGLAFDVETLIDRRQVLKAIGDDGGVHELGTVTGSVSGGLTVELAVPVSAA